jgi:predicted transcriptional regulator
MIYITPVQEKILKVIQENPGLIIKEIVQKLGSRSSRAGDRIRRLEKLNLVKVQKRGCAKNLF